MWPWFRTTTKLELSVTVTIIPADTEGCYRSSPVVSQGQCKQTKQFHQAAAAALGAFINNHPAFTLSIPCSGPVRAKYDNSSYQTHLQGNVSRSEDKGYFGSLVRVGSIKICSVGE